MKNKKILMIGIFVTVIIISTIIVISLNKNVTPKNHLITFDSNGGTFINSQVVKTGEKITQPEEPLKDGYIFISWNLKNKTYDFNKEVKEDLTLKAKWEELKENQLVIKFNSAGGTTVPTQVINKGDKVTLPEEPKQDGYIFKGWKEDDKKYDFSTKPSEDKELVAEWEKDKNYKEPTTSETKKEEEKPTNTPTKSETVTNPKRNRNTIHFISTGSSDAMLIESNGIYGLIDSSNPYNDGTQQSISTKAYTVEHVKEYLDSLGIKYLDFVLATHSHSDHIGGMVEIAKKYMTNRTTYFYRKYSGASDNQPTWDNEGYYKRAISAVQKTNASMVELTNKTPTYKFGNFSLTFLNTDSDAKKAENYNAIGTLVKLGKTKVFLSSDIEKEDANKISSSIGQVDVLKLNHHGYSGAPFEYLFVLKPKYIVVTNNQILPQAKAPIAFAKENFNTTTYLTGNVKDAIKLNITESGYSFENSGNPVNITTTEWINWLGKYVYLKNGKIQKSWLEYKGNWYYLNNQGIMVTGWHELNWSGGKNWFYFGTDGIMYKGWKQVKWSGGTNWFYFDTTHGFMKTGWQQLDWSGGKDWFYFEPTHGYLIQNKCMTINNVNYCFDKDGACTTGC